MLHARLALVLAAAAAFASCAPKLDANGSNPSGLPSLAPLYASDPVLGYDLSTDTVLLAYDDEAGAFDADVATRTLVPRPNATRAGLSVSPDHGRSWTRIGPVAPADAGCGDQRCAVRLDGSPSLAPLEASGSVVYVSLASTDAALREPDAIAYAASTDAGAHWSAPRVAGYLAGRPPGEPSLGRAGNATLVAYTDRVKGELQLVVADGEPPALGAAYAVPIERDDVGVPKAHPIVRMVTGLKAYVAYLLPRDDEGTTFDLRMALLTRDVTKFGLSPWQGLVVFRLNDVAIDATRPGALGRTWRDDAPVAFAVGHGPRLYLAYRQRSSRTGSSEVFVAQCDASTMQSCAVESDGTNATSWSVSAVADLVPSAVPPGGQLRPLVAADALGSAVAFGWMQEVTPGSSQVTLFGTLSTSDAGLQLGAATDLRAGAGGGPWTPCPTAATVDAVTHSYGAHDALVVVPPGPTANGPAVVGAHVDSSGGCEDLGPLTFDQHVAVSPW